MLLYRPSAVSYNNRHVECDQWQSAHRPQAQGIRPEKTPSRTQQCQVAGRQLRAQGIRLPLHKAEGQPHQTRTTDEHLKQQQHPRQQDDQEPELPHLQNRHLLQGLPPLRLPHQEGTRNRRWQPEISEEATEREVYLQLRGAVQSGFLTIQRQYCQLAHGPLLRLRQSDDRAQEGHPAVLSKEVILKLLQQLKILNRTINIFLRKRDSSWLSSQIRMALIFRAHIMGLGMEKVLELRCSLYKDRLVLAITTESHSYQSTITQGDIRTYEKQLSITLTDIEGYLTRLSQEEINQCFSFQPHNILSIRLGGLGSSGPELALKCQLTPLNGRQRSGYSSWLQEQRMLKLQSENFELKVKVQMLSNKVEEQEERIREINDWVKIEMLRLREQLEGRIESHSLQLQQKTEMSQHEVQK